MQNKEFSADGLRYKFSYVPIEQKDRDYTEHWLKNLMSVTLNSVFITNMYVYNHKEDYHELFGIPIHNVFIIDNNKERLIDRVLSICGFKGRKDYLNYS